MKSTKSRIDQQCELISGSYFWMRIALANDERKDKKKKTIKHISFFKKNQLQFKTPNRFELFAWFQIWSHLQNLNQKSIPKNSVEDEKGFCRNHVAPNVSDRKKWHQNIGDIWLKNVSFEIKQNWEWQISKTRKSPQIGYFFFFFSKSFPKQTMNNHPNDRYWQFDTFRKSKKTSQKFCQTRHILDWSNLKKKKFVWFCVVQFKLDFDSLKKNGIP